MQRMFGLFCGSCYGSDFKAAADSELCQPQFQPFKLLNIQHIFYIFITPVDTQLEFTRPTKFTYNSQNRWLLAEFTVYKQIVYGNTDCCIVVDCMALQEFVKFDSRSLPGSIYIYGQLRSY